MYLENHSILRPYNRVCEERPYQDRKGTGRGNWGQILPISQFSTESAFFRSLASTLSCRGPGHLSGKLICSRKVGLGAEWSSHIFCEPRHRPERVECSEHGAIVVCCSVPSTSLQYNWQRKLEWNRRNNSHFSGS